MGAISITSVQSTDSEAEDEQIIFSNISLPNNKEKNKDDTLRPFSSLKIHTFDQKENGNQNNAEMVPLSRSISLIDIKHKNKNKATAMSTNKSIGSSHSNMIKNESSFFLYDPEEIR